MRIPRLEIYLDEQLKLCVAKVDNEDSNPRLIFDIGLDELKSFDLDVASSKFGGTIFSLLSLWYKQAFEGWGIPLAEENSQIDDYDIAQRLIGKSILSKTCMHIPSIELLLSQETNRSENVKQFYENVWPTIRERLESFGSNSVG